MGLTTAYLTSTKNLEAFLNAIVSAQAPEKFTTTFLKQLDFTSSSDRLFIGVLKGLGFLDEDGAPQQRYYNYLDQTQSGIVLAESIREAYGDLFAINKRANELAPEDVKNKLRTLTQGQKSDEVLTKMATTFGALCDLADWTPGVEPEKVEPKSDTISATPPKADVLPIVPMPDKHHARETQLHYNIQIHLPESRDPAVYDAIFRTLKEHLL